MIVPRLDHLVLATRTLEPTVEWAGDALGVMPAPGGRHPGRGTRNFLLSLGDEHYLEVIGPDPDQPEPEDGRPFGIDALDRPRLVAWAARSENLERDVATAQRLGVDLGTIRAMSRTLPDGEVLSWRLTALPGAGVHVIPFLIDWGATRHPSASAPGGVSLLSFHVERPDPSRARTVLEALGLDVEVAAGSGPRLRARLAGPSGTLDLD